MSEQAQWVFRKLYTAGIHNGLDRLVTELVPRILTIEPLQRWFFVRFVDQGGSHLRLRLLIPHARTAALDRFCERTLQELPRLPPFLYRPALYASAAEHDIDRKSVVRMERDTYLPECDKFGVRGMAWAEELFQRSSEIAVDVLRHEDRGLYSRKSVVLGFMSAAQEAFLPDVAAPEFWGRYGRYWLIRSHVDVDAWSEAFARKTQALKDAGVVLDAREIPKEANPLLAEWREAVGKCAAAYRQDRGNDIPLAVLAMNFAHLMNNRLGLFPIEDAYYAVLLRAGNAGRMTAPTDA